MGPFLLLAALAAASPSPPEAPPALGGKEPEAALREVFDRLVERSRFGPAFKRRVRLVYLPDELYGNAGVRPEHPEGTSPAAAVYEDSPANGSGLPEVRVGTDIFAIARGRDELAFVLAHELAHLGDRHDRFMKHQNRRFVRQFKREHRDHIERAPDSAHRLFLGVHEARFPSVSRCLERAADLRARELLERAGFDPDAIPDVFERFRGWLDEQAPEGSDILHGRPEERAEAVEEEPVWFRGLNPCRGLILQESPEERGD